jgi:ribosomal-protein-alanine N-acetyltransferase
MLIRPAGTLELKPLLALEQAAQSHPWSEAQLLQSLQDDVVFVMQQGMDIVAYCTLQLVLDEASLLNVAVLPTMRRRGLARQLLEHAFGDARRRGCARCFLEVRASNASAIALYHQLGFVFDGVRRNYYPATGTDNAREDAHLFHTDW